MAIETLTDMERQIEQGDVRTAVKSLERARREAQKLKMLDALRNILPVAQLAAERADDRRTKSAAAHLVYALKQNIALLERSSSATSVSVGEPPGTELAPPPDASAPTSENAAVAEPERAVRKGGKSMFCANCGVPLFEGANFCPSCGTAVRAPTATSSPWPASALQPQPASPPAKQGWFGEALKTSALGQVHPQVICPHCQTRGRVRMKQMKVKQGISGGKATGAVLTGGLSVLATGLSKKGHVTQAYCEACGTTWNI